MKFLLLKMAVFSFTFISSCSASHPQEILQISYKSSFGLCEMPCFSNITYDKISKNNIQKIKNEQRLNISVNDTVMLEQKEWNNILNSIVFHDFYALDPIIGCPNCNDGGQSWLRITTKEKSYEVHYDYEETPIPLKNLIAQLQKDNH